MNQQILLHIESLAHGPVRLRGALPPAVFGLENDPSVRNPRELNYELTAERKSAEVLVRGRVWADMELECAKSGLFFSTKVEDSAFLRDYSISDRSGPLDLTEDVREAVVINIPPYPVSPEARSPDFVPPELPANGKPEPDGGDSPWSALNNLDVS